MSGIVFLSGENVDLAIGELRGVIRSLHSNARMDIVEGRIVIMDRAPPPGLVSRMGLAHFSSFNARSVPGNDAIEIEKLIGDFLDDLDRGPSVSVKVISPAGSGQLERSELFHLFCRIAAKKGFRLKHRKPDMRFFLASGDRTHFGTIDEVADRASLKKRRGSAMPFKRPIVMEPKLARAMVNLSGLEEGGTILDPFMGPAGLSIEAAHLGYQVVGVERDAKIFQGANLNIKAEKLEGAIDTHLGDSGMIDSYDFWRDLNSIDGIITDPPFGRAAPLKGEDPGSLVREVMRKAGEKLSSGAPLVLDTADETLLHKLEGFRLESKYVFRVHRSLTRYIARMIRK